MKNISAKNSRTLPSSMRTITSDSTTRSLLPIDTRPIYLQRGLTKKNMEALYLMAFKLYEAQKVEEALLCFKLMTLLDWSDKRAWLGSAACFERIKNYTAAIGCYKAATLADNHDPMPLFRAFHCYLEIQDKENALKALETAIQVAERQADLYSDLKKQAENIKKALLK